MQPIKYTHGIICGFILALALASSPRVEGRATTTKSETVLCFGGGCAGIPVLPIVVPAGDCLSEKVIITGTLTIKRHFTTTPGGRKIEHRTGVPHLTGVGAVSGAIYRAPGPLATTIITDNGAPVHSMLVNHSLLIGPGELPNVISISLTVREDGQIVVSHQVLGCH